MPTLKPAAHRPCCARAARRCRLSETPIWRFIFYCFKTYS
ncbi:hypothetical protein ETAE_0114 [Edwardsiella piscicida]|uniref:Uncharacterized protein n=1 Tax=Edwardsiella piscicida TaxID=1263550 RepID=A0AAU8P0K8_EDWPI|nr:hypothetical protein ETAE_0114 [Edwardsiella tarda EIB202]